MGEREVPPATLEGWYVLHQLFRLEWPRVKALSANALREIGEEFAGLMGDWAPSGDAGWSGAYRVAGGGSDYMFIHFRPSLEQLVRAERRIQRSGLGDYLRLVGDYVSVVELGLYGVTAEVKERLEREGAAGNPEARERELSRAVEEQRALPYVQQRLRPVQPETMPYVSFYPMNKRRNVGQNWYTLPLRRRSELMHEHGKVGRKHATRISQVISGSVGLDDWEWAVTLFAEDPLDFKNVVTEMRYDLASAEYADFGAFFVGFRMPPGEWADPASW